VRVEVALVFLLIAAVFGVLIAAGILILRRHHRGIIVFGIVQLAQIPILGPSKWFFCAGPYLAPVWTSDGSKLLYGIKATFSASWHSSDPVSIIGVNLVPLVILWLLYRLRSGEQM
jgi:hypothetical protein